ncbi:unnamed protein product [Arctogadus glacialis]
MAGAEVYNSTTVEARAVKTFLVPSNLLSVQRCVVKAAEVGEVKVAVLVERPDGVPALTSGRILVIEAFCRNSGPVCAAVALGTQTASGLENWGPTRSVGGYYHHALRSPEILTLVATRARSDVLPSVTSEPDPL